MLNPLETRVIAALKSAGVTWASSLPDSEYGAVFTFGDSHENGLLTNRDFERAGLLPINERRGKEK